MPDPIRITAADLQRQDVNDYVEMQKYLSRDVGPIGDQPWVLRVIYANWFYLGVCSMLGSVVGWAALEPWFTDEESIEPGLQVLDIMMFPTIAACIGLFLGAAEGFICRNVGRMLVCGAVGLGIGFLGGLLMWIPSELLYGAMMHLAVGMEPELAEGEMKFGLGMLVIMMGRGAAWALAGVPAGMGQGIALRESKVVINGIVGGLLGGLAGGLLFDPIDLALTPGEGEAAISRGVGFAAIGLFVGVFVGLVESWTKTAWLLMRKGPLAGKQFILFKDTTVLGSSPKVDVYLFKDDAIEPKHAIITNRGGRFEIEDCKTPDGTYVNGVPITRQMLHDGDQIVLGKTVLEFSVKESTRT